MGSHLPPMRLRAVLRGRNARAIGETLGGRLVVAGGGNRRLAGRRVPRGLLGLADPSRPSRRHEAGNSPRRLLQNQCLHPTLERALRACERSGVGRSLRPLARRSPGADGLRPGVFRPSRPVPRRARPRELILQRDEFAKLREFPDEAFEMCSTNPETYRLLEGMFQDLIDATRGSTYFHLSTDEAWFIG